MVLSSAFLMAVKKGPFARGGIVWKTHRFFKMSQTRQRNSVKRQKYISDVENVLKKAAESAASSSSSSTSASSHPTTAS